jgi:hypothetical protein
MEPKVIGAIVVGVFVVLMLIYCMTREHICPYNNVPEYAPSVQIVPKSSSCMCNDGTPSRPCANGTQPDCSGLFPVCSDKTPVVCANGSVPTFSVRRMR